MTDDNTTETTDTVAAEAVSNASTDAAATAEGSASDEADGAPTARPARKSREGIVVSQKMDKTAVVAVIERVPHRKYNKFVLQTKRLYAHDEGNDANVGDRVRVVETRPLSKLKRWRVSDVIERAK